MQQTIDTIVDCVERALPVEDPRVGLVDFLEAAMRAQATDRGLREVLMGITLAEWIYVVGALLNRAMVLTGDYYGWGMDDWQHVVHSRLSSWREAVQTARQSRT
jgi:hypothetical protein